MKVYLSLEHVACILAMISSFLCQIFGDRLITADDVSAGGSSVSAVCFLPSGNAIYGNSDCTDGEVQLLGRYVNLGIHNSGSFGTQAKLGRSYYDDRLGFLADFDKNGMDSKPSPSFAGDYFIPGLPLEGQRISHVPYLLCAFFYM